MIHMKHTSIEHLSPPTVSEPLLRPEKFADQSPGLLAVAAKIRAGNGTSALMSQRYLIKLTNNQVHLVKHFIVL